MFRLQPHHLPPGCNAPLEAPADAVFQLSWRGTQREVALRWMQLHRFAHVLWVRVDGEIGIATHYPSTVLEAPMKWKIPHLSPRKMLSLARNIERGRELGWLRAPRSSPDYAPLLLLARSDEWGLWLDEKWEIVGDFSLRDALDTPAAWQAAFDAAWNDPNSDARMAWKWARMNDPERRAWLYDGARGFDELKTLVRLVLQSADELWPRHEEVFWTRALDGSQSWIAAEGWWLQDAPGEVPRLERWRRFLDKRFCTARFGTAARQRLMVQWICNEVGTFCLQIEVPRPSFHERLEARLELREWLQHNTSPQQRRWLLPP